MPSPMPSSFASAAAGQSSNRDARPGGRGDSRGSGDWPRKDSRNPNGTLTLRRTSTTPHSSSSQIAPQLDQANPLPSTESVSAQSQAYFGPVSEGPAESRYSKSKILEIYRTRQGSEESGDDVTRLFVNNWDPTQSNGTGGRGWGKSVDGRDHNPGPDVCWDQSGQIQPISLEEMSGLEKSLFTSDVNSPLKPPPQNPKDQNASGSTANGRKPSISQGTSNFGLSSPTTGRPSTRRRETSENLPYSMVSPGGTGRFNRDETSSFFNRKSSELKDGSYALEDRLDETFGSNGSSKTALPFGGLIRSNTVGTALGNGPSSPWGNAPTSATLSPMGNFGSFALPSSSSQPPNANEKRPGLGRGESRLAHLMPKEGAEDLSSRTAETARPWRARARTDTDPFGDESGRSGSASLGGGQDMSPILQQHVVAGLDTPSRQMPGDFGMSEAQGFRDSMHRQQGLETPQHQQGVDHELQSPTVTNPYASPTETNPYASPPDERRHPEDLDDGSVDDDAIHHTRGQALGGIPEHTHNAFGIPRGFASGQFDGSDRSQTSSAGASKGFPSLGGLSGLGGLGGLGGWPQSANPIGTTDRDRPGFQGAFGNSVFSPVGDLQSPNLSGLGGSFGTGHSGNVTGANSLSRGSKLGSLFPAAMQAQMQGAEANDHVGDIGEQRQSSAFGTIGRSTFNVARETDSSARTSKAAFEDMFSPSESRNPNSFAIGEAVQTQTSAPQTGAHPQSSGTGINYQPSQSSSDSASNQLPPAQQRTMVMPDRMRWVYLDPQGQTQGPWSGLEMHDWYKASFFTADLSVKKVEDAEFEPLGQLIRRIGNSREPFLVPQIGVPHGPATTQAGAPFAPNVNASGVPLPTPGAVQPPFAGAFPSFGTTLTAEQQNNLERRKQEEQYLMALQREHLAQKQQQANMKQLQMQGALPFALHHHSSAHSLQSQPSFGSMTSPINMPQGQIPGVPGGPGFFDGNARQPPGPGSMGVPPDYFREDELARLSLQERQQVFAAAMAAGPQGPPPPQIPPMFSQQADAQRDAARMEHLRQNDPQGFKARLREFEQLRAQHDLEQEVRHPLAGPTAEPTGSAERQATQAPPETMDEEKEEKSEPKEAEVLSLTQQVQKAASAKQSPPGQPESPWAKVPTGLPMPFPPPQSTTPLPAPTAQRGRSNLPDALDIGDRSRSETPDTSTTHPSVAPWAKEQVEAAKGPSLKEIQEAEARKAAKLEEAASAARRALVDQEMRVQPVLPTPGLPTTSTWGTSSSPAAPATVPSAWAKTVNTRAQIPAAASTSGKKTLADIQREEETRKSQLAAAAAAIASPGIASGGKRYADLASKPTTGPPAGAAWSTVGAGGKVKVPTGPSTSSPTPIVRAATSAAIPITAGSKTARPVATNVRTATSGSGLPASSNATAANLEFTKWAKGALAKGLNSDINVDEFVQMLSEFPGEPGVIADSVYANSQLMDGRRFAEEFLRRKKLAEKGIIESASTTSTMGFSTAGESKSTGGGGWSEVAKKGPAKEESTAGFKVVPNKKKGRK